jgi:chemotaxis response regulator CheB
MPKEAINCGAVAETLPLESISAAISNFGIRGARGEHESALTD